MSSEDQDDIMALLYPEESKDEIAPSNKKEIKSKESSKKKKNRKNKKDSVESTKKKVESTTTQNNASKSQVKILDDDVIWQKLWPLRHQKKFRQLFALLTGKSIKNFRKLKFQETDFMRLGAVSALIKLYRILYQEEYL
jgi:hypothetical protein